MNPGIPPHGKNQPVPGRENADRAQAQFLSVWTDAELRHAREPRRVGETEIAFLLIHEKRNRGAAELRVTIAQPKIDVRSRRKACCTIERKGDLSRNFCPPRGRADRNIGFAIHDAARRPFDGATCLAKNSKVRGHAAAAACSRYLSLCGSMKAWPVPA